MRHRPLALLMIPALLLAVACGDDDDDGQIGGELILATTTSTQDSGLLDVLEPMFEDQTGTDLKVIAVGTGAALAQAGNGDADAVLVHAPDAEQEYVDSGDLVEGELIMHNDYVIVGPPGDPAGVAAATAIQEAMELLAATTFISRGDDSGTNKKELALWEAAGIDTSAVDEYVQTGDGMGATLNVANEQLGYTLTDRATYLALSDDLDLEIAFEGAEALFNIYHAYVVSPEKHDGINAEQARAFVEFLVDAETQEVIGEFGVEEFGEPLFVPDADTAVAAE